MVLIFGVVIPLVQFIQDQVQSWLLQMNSRLPLKVKEDMVLNLMKQLIQL